MWRVTDLMSENVQYDFSAAGLSTIWTRTIYLNVRLFCNGDSLVQWEQPGCSAQVIVCETCGISGCQSAGYIAMRTMGDFVAAIPDFGRILGPEEFGGPDYRPPESLRKHGAPYWSLEQYEGFRCSFPGFPRVEKIPPLSRAEAFHLIRMKDPGRVLGDPYSPVPEQAYSESVLASTHGEPDEWFEPLLGLLESPGASMPAIVKSPEPEDERVSLIMDLSGFPEWPVAWAGKEKGIYLNEEMKLVC